MARIKKTKNGHDLIFRASDLLKADRRLDMSQAAHERLRKKHDALFSKNPSKVDGIKAAYHEQVKILQFRSNKKLPRKVKRDVWNESVELYKHDKLPWKI
jgi:hypothetical protein